MTKLHRAIAAAIVSAAASFSAVINADAAATQPQLSVPLCELPSGVWISCFLYDNMTYAGETTPPVTTTYTTLTPAMVGTTDATAVANFPSLIATIFGASPYINIQVANMDPASLALFSHDYYVSTKGQMAPMLTAAAERLSAVNLWKLAGAFGVSVVQTYITDYSPAAVKTSFNNYVATEKTVTLPLSQADYNAHGYSAYTMSGLSTGLPPSGGTLSGGSLLIKAQPDAGYIPQPSPTMALTDIWLEFYVAGTGTTVVEATVMFAKYVSPYASWAGWAGWKFGTGIYDKVEELKPGFFEDIIEFYGPLYSDYVADGWILTPTGTVTVGEPITNWDNTGQNTFELIDYDISLCLAIDSTISGCGG